MRLEDIGFYTLSDERATNSSSTSPLKRCELILTDRCNFKCPYCRGLREDLRGSLPFEDAMRVLRHWVADGLENVRFSGGEPGLYPRLEELVSFCRENGVGRVAVSTNGSLSLDLYERLIRAGVNDFSVSLDACCAQMGDAMAGRAGAWEKVVENIRALSRLTYVTVGMVFTEDNVGDCVDSVLFADSLGVSDIRVIPSAQYNQALAKLKGLPRRVLEKYPILRYRIDNLANGEHVRGIREADTNRCPLVLDDMAVAGNKHFPCIIYMREQGDPVGDVGPGMRQERLGWFERHDSHKDPICRRNCLDVCVLYNNKSMQGRIDIR